MRVLITRHLVAAGELGALLDAKGFETQIEPLLKIKFNLRPVPLDDVQALIVTSPNGAVALADCTDNRKLVIFAVGERTSDILKIEGFTNIKLAGGDVTSLVELVTQTLSPDAGTLVHISSQIIAGDLKGDLMARGFAVRRDILYQAETSSVMSAEVIRLFAARKIDVVLFFSNRTAMTFASIISKAGLYKDLDFTHAICLSQSVAKPIQRFRWRNIEIAETPDQRALIKRLIKIRSECSSSD